MTHARLIDANVPADPRGIVIALHGGAARRGQMRVSPAQLSVLRMVPIAHRITRAAPDELVVQRLLNSVRGWDAHHTPVHDVTWALDRAHERFGADLPVCLVGHSLGGRAALLAARNPQVHSVVALAPWVYPYEGRTDLGGKQVLIVHGDDDRIAQPAHSAAVARDLARTARVGYITVEGGKHAMLRHHALFDGFAAQYAAATLLGDAHLPADGAVADVLRGEHWVAA